MPRSEQEVEDAKKVFEAGRQAYEVGRYADAIVAFEEALRLSPRPPVLFSLAQAYRQQYVLDRDPPHLKRALELFREYVKQVPKGGRRDHAAQHIADLEPQLRRIEEEQRRMGKGPIEAPATKGEAKTQLMVTSRTPRALAGVDDEEPSPDLPVIRDVAPGPHRVRVQAEGFIPEDVDAVAVNGRLVVVDVNLKEKPAIVRLDAPEGAQVSLDGRLIGTAPLTAPLEVASGRHLLVVTEKGSYGFARELTLGRGEESSVRAELETTTQRSVSYFFLGTAGALLAAGGIAGGIALSAEGGARAIDDARTMRRGLAPEQIDAYRRKVARRDALAPVSYGLLGGSLAVGVTGLLLFLIDSPRIDSPTLQPGTIGALSIDAAGSLSAHF